MKNREAHILLVENDPQVVSNLLHAFKALGIDNPVHVVTNCREALERVQGKGDAALSPIPKIILLDLDLPEMNGLHVLEALRKEAKWRASCVFVITGSSTNQQILQAYDFNVAGFIKKPVQYASIQEMVATLQSYWNLIELPN
ncbi:response regulator [Rufibacter soli]